MTATPKKIYLSEVIATLTQNSTPTDDSMASTLEAVQDELLKERADKGKRAMLAVARHFQVDELALRKFRAEVVAPTEAAYKARLTGYTKLFEKIGSGDLEALDNYDIEAAKIRRDNEPPVIRRPY